MVPLTVALLAFAAGCGTARGLPAPAGSAPKTTQPASGVPSPAAWTTTVVRAPDGDLLVTVTVIGPLTVEGGCVPSLTAWAVTAGGAVVPTPSPSGPAVHCLAIALISVPAGTSRAFTAEIPMPPSPGTYSIHGQLKAISAPGQAIPVANITI